MATTAGVTYITNNAKGNGFVTKAEEPVAQAKATDLPVAQATAIDKTLNFAVELMIELQVHDTIKSLQDLPVQIGALQQKALSAKTRAETFKLGALASAKERYEQAVLAASMEAPCDGKNAEARAMQLKAHLAKDEKVINLAVNLEHIEEKHRVMTLDAERQEAELDMARNRFRGVLAVAGLQEAVLRATRIGN